MATATKSKSKIKLAPLGERVVVERDEQEEVTTGGIVLPGSAQDKPAIDAVSSPCVPAKISPRDSLSTCAGK